MTQRGSGPRQGRRSERNRQDLPEPVIPQPWEPTGGMPALRITNVKTVLTAPADQPGGGQGGDERAGALRPGLRHLHPARPSGRDRHRQVPGPFPHRQRPDEIEDIWQAAFVSSYWRNGPVLNNAISGVDMALWDILGKRADAVYQIFGGKCRNRVPLPPRPGTTSRSWRKPSGATWSRATATSAARWASPATPPTAASAYRRRPHAGPAVSAPRPTTNARERLHRQTPSPGSRPPTAGRCQSCSSTCARTFGDEVELLHDIHERVPPILAMQLVKDSSRTAPSSSKTRLTPEDIGYFAHLRKQTTTPIAMGELFNNPHEWTGRWSRDRLIDFIRVHISQIGGLSLARKMAAMCEFFAVRTAWHGPGDVSPVGHAANLHLDLASPTSASRRPTSSPRPTGTSSPAARSSTTATTGQRQARPGHRPERGPGREVPLPRAPPQRRLAAGPPADGTVVRP